MKILFLGKRLEDRGDWFWEDKTVSQGHRENAKKHFWELVSGRWIAERLVNQGF